MESYNLKNLSEGLQEVRAQGIKGKDVGSIATAEGVNQSTVYEYLKGNVAIPALGKSILKRCRAILMERIKSAA